MKTQFNQHVDTRRDENYALLVTNYRPQRSIPEIEFLRGFYAFFRGEVKDHNDALKVHRNWVQVAGSQFDEVQIIDAAGRPLYVVPSIATSEAIRTSVKRQGGLLYNAIPADAHNAQMNAQLPSQAQEAIYESLSKNIQDDETAMVEHKKKWDDLIAFFDKRLGLTPLASKAEDKKNIQASADLHDELF